MSSEAEIGASVRAARERLRTVGRLIGEWTSDSLSGHRIVCVYDTDVVMMYSRADLSASYCALFREEGESRRDFGRKPTERNKVLCEAEVRLAEIIGNHIVWRRTDPALNSPAHADELADVCNVVFGGAISEVPRLKDRLHKSFNELAFSADIHENPEIRIDRIFSELSAEVPRVFEALRLEAAFMDNRLFSVDGFSLDKDESQIPGTYHLPSGLDAETGDFIEDILVLARQLETVLAARASVGEFDPKQIRADARALAHLCWVNQQLEGDSRQERVRFVTGAHQLHRLCSFPADWHSQVSPRVFSTLEALVPELRALLRHPIAFTEDSLDVRLGAWLSDRLPDGTSETSENERFLQSAAEDWMDLLRAARAREAVSAEWRWLKDIVADIEQGNDLNETLNRRVDTLLPRFLASIAVLQRPAGHRDSISRNLPPLTFSAFPKCRKFCDQLYLDYAVKMITPDVGKALLSEVIESDPSLYTPLIAVALWRAADRDWPRVRIMTRSAVEIAEQYVRNRASDSKFVHGAPASEAIYGEEALYLYAVATRLTAGTGHRHRDALVDLQDALDTIIRAQKRLAQFNSACGLKTQDRRFDSEEVSIRLTQILFARLCRRGAVERETERELFDSTWKILINHLADGEATNQEGYQFEYILQQLCTSLSQLVLLDRYALSGNEVFPIVAKTWSEQAPYLERIKFIHEQFGSQCLRLRSSPRGADATALPVVSSFVTLAWLSFDAEFRTHISVREAKDLLDELRVCTSAKHRIASIDEVRFNFLNKIAQRKLTQF